MRNVVPMSHRFVIWINPEKKKRKTYLSYHRLVLITGEALQCPVQLDQSGQPAETVMSSDAANTLSLKGNKARNQFN